MRTLRMFLWGIIGFIIGFAVTFLIARCSRPSWEVQEEPSSVSTQEQETLSLSEIILNKMH